MKTRKGAPCWYPAGMGTGHPGWGSCNRHGGAWPQSEEIWNRAMEIANRENITPTDALLSLVRASMGRVAFVDNVLTEKMREHIEAGGDAHDPPAEVKLWMGESRKERLLATKTAQSAVSAGVMVVLAQRVELDGGLVADAVTAALDSLNLTTEQRMKALGVAQEKLLTAE